MEGHKIKFKHNGFKHTANLITCKNINNNTAIVDSGTTCNYLTKASSCVDKQIMQQKIYLHMPNVEVIESSHKAILPMTHFPLKAIEAITFPKSEKALLSVSTLCNNGCKAIFDSKGVDIIEEKGNKIILQSIQKNILYLLDMKSNEIMTDPNPDTLLANHVYENKSNMDLVVYYH